MEIQQNTYLIVELDKQIKGQYITMQDSEESIIIFDIDKAEVRKIIKAFIPKTYTVILLD